MPAQISGHVIKRRARELRALSEEKSAAFRQTQIGRTLRVLTLRASNACAENGVTPALSTNYLQVHVPGELPPNQFVEARIAASGPKKLLARAPDLEPLAAELIL